MCCVRSAIIIRGILLHFSAITSPIQYSDKKEYDPNQHCYLQGHLCDTDDSIVISILGLLKDQYENPLHFDLIRTITLKHVLQKKYVELRKYDAKEQDKIERAQKLAIEEDQERIHNKTNAAKTGKHDFIADIMNIPEHIFEEGDTKSANFRQNITPAAKQDHMDQGDLDQEDLVINDPKSKSNVKSKLNSKVKSKSKRKSKTKFDNSDSDSEKEEEEESSMDETLLSKYHTRNLKQDNSESENEENDISFGLKQQQKQQPTNMEELDNKIIAELSALSTLSTTQNRELLRAIKRNDKRINKKYKDEAQANVQNIPKSDWEDNENFWKQTKEYGPENNPSKITYHDLLDFVDRDADNPNFFRIEVEAIKKKYKTYDDDKSISDLAKDLIAWLRETPSEDVVFENIKSLCHVTRLVTKTKNEGKLDNDYEHPFYINKNFLMIRRDIIRYNSKNKMEEAVKNIYQTKETIPSDKIFGMDYSDTEHYHQFKVIRLEPNNKDIILPNREYVSEQSKELTHINLRNIYQNQYNLIEKNTDSKRKHEDISIASKLNYDFPLASGVFIRHIQEIGWNKQMCMKLNVWPEAKMNELIKYAYKKQADEWKIKMQEARIKKDITLIQHLASIEPIKLKSYPGNLGLFSRSVIEEQFQTEFYNESGEFKQKYSYGSKIAPIAESVGITVSDMDYLRTGKLNKDDMNLMKENISKNITCFISSREKNRNLNNSDDDDKEVDTEMISNQTRSKKKSTTNLDVSLNIPKRRRNDLEDDIPPLEPPGDFDIKLDTYFDKKDNKKQRRNNISKRIKNLDEKSQGSESIVNQTVLLDMDDQPPGPE